MNITEKVTIETFNDFCHNVSGDFEPWLHEEKMDISGGIVSIADIDRIKDYPDAEVVMVSGLNQETFEYFIKTYGQQFKAIRFFKNKLVEDWSLLGGLPNLEFIYWFFNQRITSFWDMSKNTSLKAVAVEDFSKLNSIEMIDTAPALEQLSIGNAVWAKSVVDSYNPAKNTKLKKLEFYGAKILDTDFSFVLEMPWLQVFNFHANLLTTEQVAWIVANRPDLKGWSLCAVQIDEDFVDSVEYKRVTVTGKGKRSFVLKGNEKRLDEVEKEFRMLVGKYKGMPYPRTSQK